MRRIRLIIYITLFFLTASSFAAGRYSVAVMKSVKTNSLSVIKSNFKVRSISYDKFSEISKYDCLIISDEIKLTDVQRKDLLNFLKSGKDLVLLGANDMNMPELPMFERRDIYRYEDAKVIKTYKQDVLTSQINIKGSFSGLSSIAFEYPEVSRYIPLLAVEDKYSRNIGFACGLLVNYAGEFKGSNWFLCGVETPEFYTSSDFADIIKNVINTMKNKDLAAKLKQQDIADEKKCLPITSSAPEDFVKLSSDGKHFILPNGKKFFALGCNYIGSFERKTEYGERYYNVKRLEQDFKKAKEAGINAFRFWNVRIDQDTERFKTIIELARKYQIYLILLPKEHPLQTNEALIDVFERNASVAANETIVLGYDFMNEPYITMIGSMKMNGKPSAILQHKVYERYSDKYFDKNWVEYAYKHRDWPELGKWIKGIDAKNLYAAHSMAKQYIEKFNPASDYSCLYGINGPLPIEPDYKEFFQAVDDTFAYWIYSHQQAIRQIDKKHFFTVGYNTSLAALPCNALLDFTSHHIYQKPFTYEDVKKSVTTFDRLRALWPKKPITIGEFGFTGGTEMPNGSYLGYDAAGVLEMMVYLYSFANDYSGAYLWMISEWPLANMKYNAWWIGPEKQVYESQFGMYYYDGTEYGHPKPIAYATKFFREYIDTHETGRGKFDLVHADTPMQAGYVFTDKDALFVGNTKYNSSQLKFSCEKPINVMITWNADKLKVMATDDAEVEIDMTQFGFTREEYYTLSGSYDSFLNTNGTIKIKLLEGQPVTFFMERNR
ncbi:MAG: hypothetical protein A2Y12_12105 [Planctomycetes bacterium GWF2_42_9]|nr:MAG: hypothetical protein A2Y12_12105 [Planctomycetes bacterium GWF2_42_9]